MSDEELSELLGKAKSQIVASADTSDIEQAEAYSMRSIALSLFIIAERTVNKGRKKRKE